MIRGDGTNYCIDPAGGIADALGKKWTLPLIGILGNRPTHRFTELRRGLRGIGAKTLSARLRELQALGLVSRDGRRSARERYRLSGRGVSLRRALIPLLEWAAATGLPARSRGANAMRPARHRSS